MPLRIEDYALVGDTETAALVGIDGSIDWLCVPRFDSPACFAALLGDGRHGRWSVAPSGAVRNARRRYRPGSLVLETELAASGGVVRVIDFMPPRAGAPRVVRCVEGLRGAVAMRMELVPRFDYGSVVPWMTSDGAVARAIGGPDALVAHAPAAVRVADGRAVAEFVVREGERLPLQLAWHPSHEPPPAPVDAFEALERTDETWSAWSSASSHDGPWRDAVLRSVLTLKALTYAPTGGVVAAPTTSLPELLGGVRNWDYRFCWVRDAAFTLYALLAAGFRDEARAWRDWLLRAIAGTPEQLQIMYGIAGERRLPETTLPWLPGYAGSSPVRIGNAAVAQLQHDVFGEAMACLYLAGRAGVEPVRHGWGVVRALLEFLESRWTLPDDGIWEMRGARRNFTHSKVMAWVAFDRAVKAVESFGVRGPAERWRAIRDEIHADVCEKGYDRSRRTFTQAYGSGALDASLLTIPLVGFLPPDDPRVEGTVRAVQAELSHEGFVRRYQADEALDGLPPGEGVFLPCTFWLADALALAGDVDAARAILERLLRVRNDVGLLAEEYDPVARRLLGNFPQAITHVALVNTASILASGRAPADDGSTGSRGPVPAMNADPR